MYCDICGKKDASFIIMVEGAKMAACRGCAYHGKILLSLEEGGAGEGRGAARERAPRRMREEEDLVEGYGMRIRTAREKRGLRLEEFARQISQKANYLDMIEREKTRPPLEIARKIEKALGITLVEIEEESIGASIAKKGSGDLSLLDMLEMQNKKKEKK
ncbi:MAG: multiprotein-bridging factor 1 family protein [Candidatus Bilamarchaeaceae archaeon]